MKTNLNAIKTIQRNTIFTNVAETSDGGVYWEGLDQPLAVGTKVTSWRNKEWSPADGRRPWDIGGFPHRCLLDSHRLSSLLQGSPVPTPTPGSVLLPSSAPSSTPPGSPRRVCPSKASSSEAAGLRVRRPLPGSQAGLCMQEMGRLCVHVGASVDA